MNKDEFNEWSKWLVENYDARLPITITVPFRQGKFVVDAQLDAAIMILEKLINGENE
jgi:hypothetical protein